VSPTFRWLATPSPDGSERKFPEPEAHRLPDGKRGEFPPHFIEDAMIDDTTRTPSTPAEPKPAPTPTPTPTPSPERVPTSR
jgi:hypothetical protein